MKKVTAILMALFMCLTMAACGGVDSTAVREKFNSTNDTLTSVSTLANENIAVMDQATVDALNKIATAFEGYKSEIESEDLTQERADAIVKELDAYPDQIAKLKTQVEDLIKAAEEPAEEPAEESTDEPVEEPTDEPAEEPVEEPAEEPTDEPTEEPTDDLTEEEAGLADFLAKTNTVTPPDVAATGWEFAGGRLDGVEMEQADADAVLEQYGGMLQIVFEDETTADMVQGGGMLTGTYGLVDPENEYVLEIVFDNAGSELKYSAIFADVEGTYVLMLLPDATGLNVLYFTMIDEY